MRTPIFGRGHRANDFKNNTIKMINDYGDLVVSAEFFSSVSHYQLVIVTRPKKSKNTRTFPIPFVDLKTDSENCEKKFTEMIKNYLEQQKKKQPIINRIF